MSDPLIGHSLKRRYRIQMRLGAGGYGAVYLATDLKLRHPVAVKVLDPVLARNATEVQRFLDETRRLYQLRHSNIVAIRDYGLDLSRYFIVMKYYNAGSLSRWLEDRRRLTPTYACRILAQVAAGLDAAHRLGIIHRDVKPQNVLLEKNGYAALGDFGIAKTLQEINQRAGRTDPNHRLGAPPYMSPEQIQGGYLGPTSDIYSLGVMAFQMLTGWLPFERETDVSMLYAHVHEPPPSIRQYDPGLPDEMARVINWALQKDPAARPHQASLFTTSLAATADVRVSQVMRPIQIQTPLPNHTGAVSRRIITQPPSAPQKPASRTLPWWLIVPLIVIAILIVLVALSSQTLATATSGGLSAGQKIAMSTIDSGQDRDVAVWQNGHITVITQSGSSETRPVWSPDGQWLAYVSNKNGRSQLYAMDATGKKVQQLTQSTGYNSGPSWSPDGKRLAFDSNRYSSYDIFIMNADGSGQHALMTNSAFDGDPAWSPKDDRIAFTSDRDGSYQLYLIDTDGNLLYRLTTGPKRNSHAAWSPDATQIAFECEQDSGVLAICIINADATNRRVALQATVDLRQPSWSADGQWLAYTRAENPPTIYVARIDGSGAMALTSLSGDTQMPDWWRGG